MNLVDLPNIVLIQIFEHLSYEEVSKKRLVCGKVDVICQHILNGGFNKVVRQHGVIYKRIKSLLPRRESERRNHCMASHADILSSIETRLSMLSMTYTKYIDLELCCFIPGRVLDEILRILRLISNTVKPLRTHEVLQELRDISSMAIEHFDEKIAATMKRSYSTYANNSRASNTTDANKNKISKFFSDYLDNKTNMLLLNNSGSHPLPVLNDSVEHVSLFQASSHMIQSDSTETERTESLSPTKKLDLHTKSLSPNTHPYKLINVNGNCRLAHLVKNGKGEDHTEDQAKTSGVAVDSSNVKNSCKCHCPDAKATNTYFKKLELEYKKGILKMQRMQQIQTQQSRRLQQALSSVAELNVQIAELRKRLVDVDAKNREITASIKQINTGDGVGTVAENSVSAFSKSGNSADDSGTISTKSLNDTQTIVKHSKRSHEGSTLNSTINLSIADDFPSENKRIKY